MFGSRASARRNRQIHKYGRSTRPLRLEVLERRDQPASLSVLPALHETAIEPALDIRALIGLTPAIVRNAYGFGMSNVANAPGDGFGQTIAIVTAFNHPYIQSDLRAFDDAFGLPHAPSFSVVSATSVTNSAWATEAALDVQWAHAIAPRANLLLVQAGSDSVDDMMNAVDFARRQAGVSVVSMSWGTSEFFGQRRFDHIFSTPIGHSPVSFIAASGDDGAAAGVSWPASVPSVLAVGGTKLTVDATGNYVGETAWSGSGGGYSQTYTDIVTGNRAVPDVAYAADPGSGFLVYNSMPDARGRTGWFRVGGTSAGAPQWAGIVALANEARAADGVAPIGNARAAVKSMTSDAFNDIVTGSNGLAATKGFDLATGVGSPRASHVINQLASQPAEKAAVVMGPMAPETPAVLKKTTATPPPARDTTQALILAGIAQQNAARAFFILNASPAQVPTTVGEQDSTREVPVPPVLVTPATASTYTSWDQSIRHSSGSSEHEGAPVPALPGEPVPGGPPAGAVSVAPPTTSTIVRTAGRKQAGTPAARQSSAVATTAAPADEAAVANEDPTLISAAIAFCFLGGCFVGLEPKRAEKKKPTIR